MINETRLLLEEFHNSRDRLLSRQILQIDRFVRTYLENIWQKEGYLDLRHGHLSCLLNVLPEGSSVNYLANKAYVSKQAMSQLVKELEVLMYIKIVVDEQDRRAKVITLTEKSVNLIKLLREASLGIDERFLNIIGLEKFEQLLELQGELAVGLHSA